MAQATAIDPSCWVHLSNHSVDALLSQVRHHEPCWFPGVALTLVSCAYHPSDLGNQLVVLLADGGLDGTERFCTLAGAHYPVEPALRTVWRSTHQLAPVAGLQLVLVGRLTADEGVARRVVQHRRELVGVLDAQRLHEAPLGGQHRSHQTLLGRLHRRHNRGRTSVRETAEERVQ